MTITCKYDDKGNHIEQVSYNADGSVDSKWTYQYDDKGNQIEMVIYNKLNEPETKTEYIYSK